MQQIYVKNKRAGITCFLVRMTELRTAKSLLLPGSIFNGMIEAIVYSEYLRQEHLTILPFPSSRLQSIAFAFHRNME